MTAFHETDPCDRDGCVRPVEYEATRPQRDTTESRDVCGPCARVLHTSGWSVRVIEEGEP